MYHTERLYESLTASIFSRAVGSRGNEVLQDKVQSFQSNLEALKKKTHTHKNVWRCNWTFHSRRDKWSRDRKHWESQTWQFNFILAPCLGHINNRKDKRWEQWNQRTEERRNSVAGLNYCDQFRWTKTRDPRGMWTVDSSRWISLWTHRASCWDNVGGLNCAVY